MIRHIGDQSLLMHPRQLRAPRRRVRGRRARRCSAGARTSGRRHQPAVRSGSPARSSSASRPCPSPTRTAGMDPADLATVDAVRLFVERAQAVAPTFALTAANADGRGPAVPSPRRAAAGDRACRVAGRRPAGHGDRRSAGRSLRAPGRRQPDRAVAPADAQGDPRLELQPAHGRAAPRAPCDSRCSSAARRSRQRSSCAPATASARATCSASSASSSSNPWSRSTMRTRSRATGCSRRSASTAVIDSSSVGERGAIEAAHAAWALRLAAQAEVALPGNAWQASLARLELDHDNLRAALDRSLTADAGARPAPRRQHVAVVAVAGLPRGGTALAWAGARPAGTPSADRAHALVGLAALTIRSGEPGAGARHAGEAFADLPGLGDTRGACRALQVLGVAAWSEDDLPAAEDVYRQA